jgi:hypothetical protein
MCAAQALLVDLHMWDGRRTTQPAVLPPRSTMHRRQVGSDSAAFPVATDRNQ